MSCHSQVYQWRNNLTCYRPDGTYEYMITKVRKASQLEVSSFDLKGALFDKADLPSGDCAMRRTSFDGIRA
ncbi:MAG: hypothetical protein IPL73_19780 [Candidatus Obscuribacter sp.]|nr:hypothetical protein [Candidatus Obscuribacter sp.]